MAPTAQRISPGSGYSVQNAPQLGSSLPVSRIFQRHLPPLPHALRLPPPHLHTFHSSLSPWPHLPHLIHLPSPPHPPPPAAGLTPSLPLSSPPPVRPFLFFMFPKYLLLGTSSGPSPLSLEMAIPPFLSFQTFWADTNCYCFRHQKFLCSSTFQPQHYGTLACPNLC